MACCSGMFLKCLCRCATENTSFAKISWEPHFFVSGYSSELKNIGAGQEIEGTSPRPLGAARENHPETEGTHRGSPPMQHDKEKTEPPPGALFLGPQAGRSPPPIMPIQPQETPADATRPVCPKEGSCHQLMPIFPWAPDSYSQQAT